MMKQIRTKGKTTDKNNTIRRKRERDGRLCTSDRDPRFRRPTENHFHLFARRDNFHTRFLPTMKLGSTVRCTLLLAVVQTAFPNPVPAAGGKEGKFFFDSFPKGITISRVTTDDNPPQTTTGYSIRFVPLITLLAGLFPNFISKLGQFTGVNKYVNTRRFDVADPLPMNHHNLTRPIDDEEFEEEDNEDDGESELIECDASHLGLWPDKSDSQRYYKCEVDPRTPASANCIKDYFQGKHLDKSDVVPLERIEVPGVKPCFLLSMMKCANGFKYSHKTRICVPDIVFGSQS